MRIVAATNRDLEEEVRTGRFREDLFYRLNVVPVTLPTLSERREDVPSLAEFFLRRVVERLGVGARALSAEALSTLARHDWPGNIRQLENTIERAALLSDGPSIEVDDLPAEIARPCEELTDPALPSANGSAPPTRRIEREAIVEALAATQGNVTRAAEQLGLSRRGLQLKMKELAIPRE